MRPRVALALAVAQGGFQDDSLKNYNPPPRPPLHAEGGDSGN